MFRRRELGLNSSRKLIKRFQSLKFKGECGFGMSGITKILELHYLMLLLQEGSSKSGSSKS